MTTIELTLAWLTHYYGEFNESPHLMVGRCLNLFKRYGIK